MHGSADRTSRDGSAAFVAASSGRATLKIWDGRFHEIHNDPGWEEITAYVLEWLRSLTGRVT